MSKRISFTLFDHSGQPLEGALPTVIVHARLTGVLLPLPAVTELGSGFYQFVVTPEVDGPTAYLINAGVTSSVQYLVGSVGELVAFGMYDLLGAPDSSRTPEFTTYTNGTVSLPHPAVVNLTGGLYGFWPQVPPGDIVYYGVGDADNTYSGTVGTTVLNNPVPAANTPILNTQPVRFDVLDSETELGRVIIGIKYESFGGATEMAWDGQAVCGPFSVGSVPITGGRRYTVSRLSGWPAAPTVRIFVTNYGGREL